MTEILTESFCERCGTRYTFEPVQSKRRALGKIGTLGRGFRHFVADPGSSLDEAFAVAKSEQEQRSTTTALEAFHRTFNFCLNCRQYTCGDCWNPVDGRCLSCAPTEEVLEPPATRMDTSVVLPPLDVARSAAAITLDDDVDLRDAGPWIGGAPPEDRDEGLAFEPRPEVEAQAAEAQAAVEAELDAEPQPAVEPGLSVEPPLDAEAPLGREARLDAGPQLDAEPRFELTAQPDADGQPESEPIPDLVSAEAIEARLSAAPSDDAIGGIANQPVLDAVREVFAQPVERAEQDVAEPEVSEAPAGEPVAAEADTGEPLVGDADAGEPNAEPAVAEPIVLAAEPSAVETGPDLEPLDAPGRPAETGVDAVEAPVARDEEMATTPEEMAPTPVRRVDGLGFEPGLNLDEQIAEYERRLAVPGTDADVPPRDVSEPAVAGSSEPVAAEPQPEPIVDEPEPVVAQTEVEPERAFPEAPPEVVVAQVAPEPIPVDVPLEPEPVAAEAVPQPVAAVVEPEPVAPVVEPEPVAAEAPPEPEPVAPVSEPVEVSADPPAPAEELPVAAAAARPPTPIEPIPTAIGKPLPASVVDGPLAWPEPDIAAAAFEQQWPDIPVPRRPPPAQPQPEIVQPVLPPPPAAAGPMRRTGANLPSVTAPPPVLSAHACPSCGLSLSASARFCRRCGTAQQVDAAH